MVVVNYRTWRTTIEAVRSVVDEPEVSEVIVVDNASGDDSVVELRASLESIGPVPVRLVEHSVNAGYGQGCQLGAGLASTPMVLFLNSDARLSPGAVGVMVDALEKDHTVGVVSPVIVQENGRPEPKTAGRFPTLSSLVVPAALRRGPRADGRTDWVAGTAMMLRTADFRAAGGFDPRFAMYMEDVDLCRSLAEAGKTARVVPGTTAVHHLGASWSSAVAKARAGSASQVAYFKKVGTGPAGLAFVRMIGLVREFRATLRDVLGRRSG